MKLGQHFMTDKKVLEKIVEYAELRPEDNVLEIGPGEGALTELLTEKCSVTAVEKDMNLFLEIKKKFPCVNAINADAVKTNWPPFGKCVSNLPYLISKKFLLKLLQREFELAVLVLQEEFAEKLVAKPGSKNYGVVSVCAQLCCDVELLDKVPRNAFKPQPKVESRIVRLRKREKLEKGFLDLVTKIFQKRNKRVDDKRVRDLTPEELLKLYRNG